MKKETGRPTRCTPEITQRLAELLKAGNYMETACAIVGIKKQIVYRWMHAGERGNPKYKPFSDAIKKAEAEGEALLLNVINRAAADGNWYAAAWRLERKSPERWGKGRTYQNGLEVEGEIKRVRLVPYTEDEGMEDVEKEKG